MGPLDRQLWEVIRLVRAHDRAQKEKMARGQLVSVTGPYEEASNQRQTPRLRLVAANDENGGKE